MNICVGSKYKKKVPILVISIDKKRQMVKVCNSNDEEKKDIWEIDIETFKQTYHEVPYDVIYTKIKD